MNQGPKTNYNAIMSRVKTVSVVRTITRSPILGALLVAGVLTWITVVVSLRHVVANAIDHGSITESASYVFISFLHTRIIVQILAGLMIVSCGMLCLNLYRKYKTFILSKVFFLKRAI